MKALSLYQPWASLMVTRWPSGRFCKRFETRGWRTNYRGPIAICSAKYWSGDLASMIQNEPFVSALAPHWQDEPNGQKISLPFGCVLGVGRLVDCVPITTNNDRVRAILTSQQNANPAEAVAELAFGLYTPGRWAWLISDMRALRTTIPVNGKQWLWEWTAPDNLEDLLV